METAANYYNTLCIEAYKQVLQSNFDISCPDNNLYELFNCAKLKEEHTCTVNECYKCPKVIPCTTPSFLTFNCDMSITFTNIRGSCSVLGLTIN